MPNHLNEKVDSFSYEEPIEEADQINDNPLGIDIDADIENIANLGNTATSENHEVYAELDDAADSKGPKIYASIADVANKLCSCSCKIPVQ
mgnify:CR=1 FL=1